MKKSVYKLFVLAIVLSTIGMIADGDPKGASIQLRYLEFFAMTASIFVAITAIYFSLKFFMNKFIVKKT